MNCFEIIKQYNIATVSFPNISTGIYRFPQKMAAKIALETIHSSLSINQNILQVNLVCFDDENYDIYRSLTQPPLLNQAVNSGVNQRIDAERKLR
nr:macro domain-containing protein [Xenorhabdus budapestensis]